MAGWQRSREVKVAEEEVRRKEIIEHCEGRQRWREVTTPLKRMTKLISLAIPCALT